MARSKARNIGVALILAVITCGLPGCGSELSAIQSDLDNNPRLRKSGIVVKVTEYNDGYVTLNVVSGLSPKAREAIRAGRGPMYLFDHVNVEEANPLMNIEEIVRKRNSVKDVAWTAN